MLVAGLWSWDVGLWTLVSGRWSWATGNACLTVGMEQRDDVRGEKLATEGSLITVPFVQSKMRFVLISSVFDRTLSLDKCDYSHINRFRMVTYEAIRNTKINPVERF